MLFKLKQFLRKFTITRLWNLLITEVQYNLKSSYLYGYPTAITIEPGNICNLRCPLCPTGQNDKSANHGFISFADFKKVIDEIGKYLFLVRLYNWGEPLLNHNLKKMIEYATDQGIEVKISTNLSMKLSDNDIEAIAKTNLRKIYISANGASKETYSKYHVGGDFDIVMNNMKRLIEKTKAANNRYTEIIWLFHVFSHNEHEIEKAKMMAKEIGIRLSINKMRTDMGKEVFETSEEAIKRDGKWLPKNPEYNIFDTRNKTPKTKFRCNLLWKETVINWDGSTLPCCFIYSEKFAFGNIRENSFKDIWNNEKYVAARKEVRSNKDSCNANLTGTITPDSGRTVCHTCKSKGFPFNQ